MKKFKILARHKWTYGATITESVEREEGKIRRFTATIRGFRNWLLYEGPLYNNEKLVSALIKKVDEIRDRIDNNDESIFDENTEIVR